MNSNKFKKEWYGMYKGTKHAHPVQAVTPGTSGFNFTFIDDSMVMTVLPVRIQKIFRKHGATIQHLPTGGGTMIMVTGKLTKELEDILRTIVEKKYFPIEPE